MITKKGNTISFEFDEDYKFLSAFEKLIDNYCLDKPELRKKIMTKFFESFTVEDK